jgi:hypothetical protein
MDSTRNLARQRAHRARVWRYANAVAHGIFRSDRTGLRRVTYGSAHDACAAGLQGRHLHGGTSDGAGDAGSVGQQKAARGYQARGLVFFVQARLGVLPKGKANGVNSNQCGVLFPIASGQHEDVPVRETQDAKQSKCQFDGVFNRIAHVLNFKHFSGGCI